MRIFVHFPTCLKTFFQSLHTLCTSIKFRSPDFFEHSFNFVSLRSLLQIIPLLPNKLIFPFASFTVSKHPIFDFACLCHMSKYHCWRLDCLEFSFVYFFRMAHFQTPLTSYDDTDGALKKVIIFHELKKILTEIFLIYNFYCHSQRSQCI